MLIHRGDMRLHKAPEGWEFAAGHGIEPDAEIELLDAELWLLHKTRSYDISTITSGTGAASL